MIKKISQHKEDDFYMLYVEGCNTPTMKYKDEFSALQQAQVLRDKLRKRVYVLKPFHFIDYDENPIPQQMEVSEELMENPVLPKDIYPDPVKKTKKRITKKAVKVKVE